MDRRKKGEYVGALGALLVHVAVIALLILVSFTVPQPDEDAGGIPVMMGNVDAARGFDDPSLVKGTSAGGTGTEGSKEGNSSTGAKTGTGGYGTFDLGGRSLGTGSLPKPAYNVQEEGRVVVNITVNPAGQVVATSINPQTNTVNSALRKAAEDAARKARFNTVDGVTNQTGTITYYFNLR